MEVLLRSKSLRVHFLIFKGYLYPWLVYKVGICPDFIHRLFTFVGIFKYNKLKEHTRNYNAKNDYSHHTAIANFWMPAN